VTSPEMEGNISPLNCAQQFRGELFQSLLCAKFFFLFFLMLEYLPIEYFSHQIHSRFTKWSSHQNLLARIPILSVDHHLISDQITGIPCITLLLHQLPWDQIRMKHMGSASFILSILGNLRSPPLTYPGTLFGGGSMRASTTIHFPYRLLFMTKGICCTERKRNLAANFIGYS